MVNTETLLFWELEYYQLDPIWADSFDHALQILLAYHGFQTDLHYQEEVLPKATAQRRSKRRAMVGVSTLEDDDYLLWLEHQKTRPRTRGDCSDEPRPCIRVGCRYNLFLEARGKHIYLTHPTLDPTEVVQSCALDVALMGGVTNEVAALYTSNTRARIQQIETEGLGKLRAAFAEMGIESPFLE